MAAQRTGTSSTEKPENGHSTGTTVASGEIYLPIEAAIDSEAERTVCSREECHPKRKRAIVSVNGEDIDTNSIAGENKGRAA